MMTWVSLNAKLENDLYEHIKKFYPDFYLLKEDWFLPGTNSLLKTKFLNGDDLNFDPFVAKLKKRLRIYGNIAVLGLVSFVLVRLVFSLFVKFW